MKVISLCVIGSLLLSGCSSDASLEAEKAYYAASLQNQQRVEKDLSQAISQTRYSIDQLAAIKQAAAHKPVAMPFSDINASQLQQKISVSWFGPIQTVVEKIAQTVGFSYQQYGTLPIMPVFINIDYHSAPAIEVLKNIQLQANNKALISILPDEKIITLRFIGND
ncbi:MAG: DotD/TraH family lipoprotein [Francisellaceae bacterium]